MDIKSVIRSQYLAALAMLKEPIEKAPDPVWNDPAHKNRFWQVAYHALFYVHLYLQTTEADFSPWEKQQDNYPKMGTLPWPPGDTAVIGEYYTKEEVLEYLAFVEKQVDEILPRLDLHAPSGFYWLPFSKIELQFYSIRHLQGHAGELSERLFASTGIECHWVGTV